MKKQVLAGALAASIAAVSIAGASLAYFTDFEVKDNAFTTGKVDITLTEPAWDLEEHEGVYPGEALAKDPQVTNETTNPVFVRIKVEGLGDNVVGTRYQWKDGVNDAQWVYNQDGYYYYYNATEQTGVLFEDETTQPLFDQIVLSSEIGNEWADKDINVKVTAEAVQAQGARAKFGTESGNTAEGDTVLNMGVDAISMWFASVGEIADAEVIA